MNIEPYNAIRTHLVGMQIKLSLSYKKSEINETYKATSTILKKNKFLLSSRF